MCSVSGTQSKLKTFLPSHLDCCQKVCTMSIAGFEGYGDDQDEYFDNVYPTEKTPSPNAIRGKLRMLLETTVIPHDTILACLREL